ncbi:MAG: cysteine dioxygenase [Aureispira sp.]|jgi:cysteine dioxygenase
MVNQIKFFTYWGAVKVTFNFFFTKSINMDSVESLEDLIECLNHSEPSNQGKILKQMNIPISDFEAYASWAKKGYTRNCINRTKEYELILLCWKKGDITPIHGHDGQKCWVYQIEGDITEIRYKKNEADDLIETNKQQLSPGGLTFMNEAMGYHRLINNTDGRAMTLHVYVSPITSCEIFNDEKNDFILKDLQYDTVHQIALAEAE